MLLQYSTGTWLMFWSQRLPLSGSTGLRVTSFMSDSNFPMQSSEAEDAICKVLRGCLTPSKRANQFIYSVIFHVGFIT